MPKATSASHLKPRISPSPKVRGIHLKPQASCAVLYNIKFYHCKAILVNKLLGGCNWEQGHQNEEFKGSWATKTKQMLGFEGTIAGGGHITRGELVHAY